MSTLDMDSGTWDQKQGQSKGKHWQKQCQRQGKRNIYERSLKGPAPYCHVFADRALAGEWEHEASQEWDTTQKAMEEGKGR